MQHRTWLSCFRSNTAGFLRGIRELELRRAKHSCSSKCPDCAAVFCHDTAGCEPGSVTTNAGLALNDCTKHSQSGKRRTAHRLDADRVTEFEAPSLVDPALLRGLSAGSRCQCVHRWQTTQAVDFETMRRLRSPQAANSRIGGLPELSRRGVVLQHETTNPDPGSRVSAHYP